MIYHSILTGVVHGLLFRSVAARTFPLSHRATGDQDVIRRDVAIIGGGSSGTYMAVKLKDAGKTFVVVEPKDQLGGHAETYYDPDTGAALNVGVQVFENTTVVRDYFARLGVALIQNPSISGAVDGTVAVDFKTGKVDADAPPLDQAAFGAALMGYAAQRAKYPDMDTGFNMTYPVAEDLLLPFGEFLAKYKLEALAPVSFLVSQGVTPYLNVSTLYVFKNFNPLQVAQPLLTTASHNTQELYQKALAEFGADVLLQSRVAKVDRGRGAGDCPVRLTVTTPGGTKTIEAKKVLFAAPPVLDNLKGWDLTADEAALFGQWHASGYYTGVLADAGLPAGVTQLKNTGPGQPLRLPELPGPYIFAPVPALNVTQVYYASPEAVSAEAAQADILANLDRYKTANGIAAGGAKPSWRMFSSHAPFNLMVSNQAIRDRFYEKAFALQGKQNTFFTGAAWTTQASNSIWEFSESYLWPMLLASL